MREFQAFASQATRRLAILDTAETLQDLAALRSNRLEYCLAIGQGKVASESISSGGCVFGGKMMGPVT